MNDKSIDSALMLSLKRKAISDLDFKALIDLAPYVEATGMTFEELVTMHREVSVMSPAEKVAMAKEEIAWLDTVIEQQQTRESLGIALNGLQQKTALLDVKIASESVQSDK